jgi:hypothetical protein
MQTKSLRKTISSTFIVAIAVSVFTLGVSSCNQTSQSKQNETAAHSEIIVSITDQEVLDIQKAWGDGVIKIGEVYLAKGDYKKVALDHIHKFYNYDNGSVLFKPTLASEIQFRTNVEGALSYFIGGNENYPEDYGFAIATPWSAVRWESFGTKTTGNHAIAMGNYYFTPVDGGAVVKAEYSFAYIKNDDGSIEIILHGSHLPYTPVAKQ